MPEIQVERRPDGRFVKGDPRINRKGSAPGQTIRAQLKRIAAEKVIVDGIETTKGELILQNIVYGAIEGNEVKQRYFLEYMYGKPKQEVDIDVDIKAKVVALAARYTPEVQAFSERFLSNPEAHLLTEGDDATNEEG